MNKKKMQEMTGIRPGNFERGPKNSITDVRGVKVGHLTVHKDLKDNSGKKIFIRTGLTAIVPYGMKEEKRLFAGCFLFRCKNEITGYEVIDDFCYLNSPVVISNSYNTGRIYNAVLSFGFSLGRTEIWPPVVLGVNDSYLNDMNKFSLDEKQILQALRDCSGGPTNEGSVGIGLGLRTFNWKGGIGTSSRRLSLDNRQLSIGVLVATNHGNTIKHKMGKSEQNIDQPAPENGSLIIVMATDTPLVPYQIRPIAASLVAGLPSINILANPKDSITCFLFSTANAMSLEDGGPPVFVYSLADDSVIETIVKAGAEAIKEAILCSLLSSAPIQGRSRRKVETIPEKEFRKIQEQF